MKGKTGQNESTEKNEEAMKCEHVDMVQTDDEVTREDLELIPDAFLEVIGECSEMAEHILMVNDSYGDDTYHYCTKHLVRHIEDMANATQLVLDLRHLMDFEHLRGENGGNEG